MVLVKVAILGYNYFRSFWIYLFINVIIIIAIYKPLLRITRLTPNVIKTSKATHMRWGEFSLNTKDENPKPNCEKKKPQNQ
jgi:hypothetical protein